MRKVYYFDMDGVIANFHKESYKYENAISREWIANLEPFMENINVIRSLIADGKSVYILTKAASENAKMGKIDFLAKYIPELNIKKRFICIVGNGRKMDYMVTKHGILVDDDMKNIRPWAKAGQDYIFVEHRGEKVNI